MKAELSSHAQRITSLLASDRESVRLNMLLMVVTLEVSKLSGWLNADASWGVNRRRA